MTEKNQKWIMNPAVVEITTGTEKQIAHARSLRARAIISFAKIAEKIDEKAVQAQWILNHCTLRDIDGLRSPGLSPQQQAIIADEKKFLAAVPGWKTQLNDALRRLCASTDAWWIIDASETVIGSGKINEEMIDRICSRI